MNDAARDILKRILDRRGPDLLQDRAVCEETIRRYFGGFEREAAVVIAALDAGVPRDLILWRERMTLAEAARRLTSKLQYAPEWNVDDAAWAVNTWLCALGLQDLPHAAERPHETPALPMGPILPDPPARSLMRDSPLGLVLRITLVLMLGVPVVMCAMRVRPGSFHRAAQSAAGDAKPVVMPWDPQQSKFQFTPGAVWRTRQPSTTSIEFLGEHVLFAGPGGGELFSIGGVFPNTLGWVEGAGIVGVTADPNGQFTVRAEDRREGRMLVCSDTLHDRELRRWIYDGPRCEAVVVAPDSRRILCRWSGGASLFDSETGATVGSYGGSVRTSEWLIRPVFNRAGDVVADCCTPAGEVRLFPVPDFSSFERVRLSESVVPSALGFAPDGRLVLEYPGEALVAWDPATHHEVMRAPDIDTRVVGLAFFGEHHAVTADAGGTLRAWDLPSGREVGRLTLAGTPLTAMGLVPGGRRVIVAHADGAVESFDIEPRP